MSEERCWFCKDLFGAPEAIRCNKCSAYQGRWRRRLPLASTVQMFSWVAAVISAIGAAVAFALAQYADFQARNSNTSISFASAYISGPAVVINAHLANSGRQASIVTHYRLLGREIHLEDAELTPLVDATHVLRSIVDAKAEFTVPLLVTGLKAKESYSRSDVFLALPGATVTLCVDVQESDRLRQCVESRPFEARLLTDVIDHRLPEAPQ